MNNLAEEISLTIMSHMTQITHVIRPDTGFDHGDGGSSKDSLRRDVGFPVHRAAPAEIGVSSKAHADLLHEVKCIFDIGSDLQHDKSSADAAVDVETAALDSRTA